MTDSERDVVREAISRVVGGELDMAMLNQATLAAIAALDAHRAGQVCVWRYSRASGGAIAPHRSMDFYNMFADVPANCPDCGKRVEVRGE